MDSLQLDAEARRYAAERNLILWEGFPWGGATVLWPEDADLAAYLDVMARLAAPVLYLEGAGEIVGFAVNGVVHAFPSSETRHRFAVDAEEGEAVSVLYDGHPIDTVSLSDPYYDYRSGQVVVGELRAVVDHIVADERFNGYRSRRLVAEYVDQLDPEEAEMVEHVAQRVFDATVGKRLDNRANLLLPDLASHPQFDALAWGNGLEEFLSARLPDEDPRVLERLRSELPAYARESGLTSEAERDVKRRGELLFGTLPPLVQDQLGFTVRNAGRLQLLAPYLADVPEIRREYVVRELVTVEAELHGTAREARYAAAVRRLLEQGLSKAETSRRLGISTSVMDRIVGSHRSDIELNADDPIVSILAPEIG